MYVFHVGMLGCLLLLCLCRGVLMFQGRQCGAYVGAVEEMMCVVCVSVKEGA